MTASNHPVFKEAREELERKLKQRILTIIELDLVANELTMPEAVLERVKDLIRNA